MCKYIIVSMMCVCVYVCMCVLCNKLVNIIISFSHMHSAIDEAGYVCDKAGELQQQQRRCQRSDLGHAGVY